MNTRLPWAPSSKVVDEIISDLELQQSGTRVTLVVDPYDLISFCFPVGVVSAKGTSPVRTLPPQALANIQVALNECFYSWPERPLLVGEYVHEMARVQAYLRSQADLRYKKLEALDKIIAGIDVEGPASADHNALLAEVEGEFNIAVAVMMGLFSFGAERLNELVAGRCLFEDTIDSREARLALSEYRPSPLAGDIERGLKEHYRFEEIPDPLEKQRTEHTIRADARAVDKVFFLNERFSGEDSGRRPHVFRYLSSAHRSQLVFSQPEVRERARRISINGRPLDPGWRSISHLLALVAHKSPERESGWQLQTLSALKQTRHFLHYHETVRQSGEVLPEAEAQQLLRDQDLPPSVLYGWQERERAIDKNLDLQRQRMTNLKLGLNVIEYERIVKRANQVMKSKGATERIKYFVKLFRRVMRDEGFRDLAIEQMQVLQGLMARTVQTGVGTNDGLVTVPLQTAPIKIRLKCPEYKRVLAKLVQYCKAPISQRGDRAHLLSDAYRLLQRVQNQGGVNDYPGELELLLCLFYISFPGIDGDRLACDRAAEAAGRFPELRSEFWYVAAWAARIIEDFPRARTLAECGRSEDPTDGRFHHALALTSYVQAVRENRLSKYTLSDAAHDAERAVECYGTAGREFREMEGVCLHNLAFFRTWDDGDPAFDVGKGREAVNALKTAVNRDVWFPEYHHSEALVEYREYERMRRERKPVADLCNKLLCSDESLAQALQGHVKEHYLELRRQLDREIDRNGCQSNRSALTW